MNKVDPGVDLSEVKNLDKDRPYLIASDKTAVQLHPLEEQALVDDMGEDAKLAIFELLNEKLASVEDSIIKKQVDIGVSPKLRRSLPSSGSNVAKVEIHMRHVYNHIVGRRNINGSENISGLYSFGSSVAKVVAGYKQGCPYAAWVLWQIEQKIKSLKTLVSQRLEYCRSLVAEEKIGIRYESFTSKKPATETITFSTVYGHQAMSALKQYDDALREIFPYLRNHFIEVEQFNEMLTISSPVRNLLLQPSAWFFIGREACKNKDEVYMAAAHRMGELPASFLSGEEKPDWIKV